MPGPVPDYAVHEKAVGLDWYALDPNLGQLLDRLLPESDERLFAEGHVAAYGKLVGGELAARAEETDKNGPRLVDGEVVHHPTWLANKDALTRAGFVGLPARAERPVPAVLTAALAYLVCQAETAIYCGLGMTAGAVDIVERHAPPNVRDVIVDRLTSLDPTQAWEGGMFLSEKQGGSDVGANTTIAVQDGDEWLLSGEKHYCSNVDAEVFIVLARPEGAPGGSRGLATYIVPRFRPDGTPNGFRINRLKPKLGTTGVPTAEVTLDGARAWLAGATGKPGEAKAARDRQGHQPDDGDGQRQPLRGWAHGPRHSPTIVPRRRDLRVAPSGLRCPHRLLSARARDARRHARRPRGQCRSGLRLRVGDAGDGER